MKVFDLSCELEHRFEGWFASQEDFDRQQAAGLVECPMCGNKTVHKLLSAPRLNVSHLQQERNAPRPPGKDQLALMQGRLLQAVREIVKSTEDVGERFPEEARRIHYGEVAKRNIRGVASPEERAALTEEGIDVQPLPFAHLFKDNVQ